MVWRSGGKQAGPGQGSGDGAEAGRKYELLQRVPGVFGQRGVEPVPVGDGGALADLVGGVAEAVAALQAGDLDRAGKAEAHFSRLFLGIRRAIALRARLRQQREEAQRRAASRNDRLQDEKDGRRHAVAEGVSRAIAAGKAEARERLTLGLWERLTENERIDADLADTALPIETLILRLGRDIGLSRRALAAGLDTADPAAAGPKASAPVVLPAGYNAGEWSDPGRPRHRVGVLCSIAAAISASRGRVLRGQGRHRRSLR